MKQTEKNLVILLALTVISGGLALYAYFGVMKPETAELERMEQHEKIFATPEPDEATKDGGTAALVFTQLSVQAKGVTATLERQGETWRLTSPVSAKAEKWVVDAITSQLQSAKFKTTVDEAPTDADLEKYGLKPPVFMVTAKAYAPDASGGGKEDPARQRTVTLYGGIENTFDGSVYVRREGDARVYAAEGSVRYALEKDIYALRDKEFLGLDPTHVQALDVTAKTGAYALEREATGSWRLTKPSAQRADADRVKRLIQSLKDQRALAFPTDSAEERTKLGLDTPLVDARFTLTSGEPVRVRFSLKQDATGTKVYALREQGSNVLLAEMPEAVLHLLDVNLAELRDKTVLAFRIEDVKRLVIHPGGSAAPIVLAHMNPDAGTLDGWRVQAPQAGMAQVLKVASLLKTLHTLKASAYGEAKPKKWETYGITESSRGVSLLDASGKELARLWIGSEVLDKMGTVYVRGAGTEVMEVDSARLSELPSRPEDVMEAAPAASATDAGSPVAQP
ncbi:DUF4340 domain-containing protein [Hyalangium rubrum]|uniref:DUF4340 domain-containing protein n=1 Tax=Hyalangium rubrum TaxID=3103134 RepID=A0ABU5H8J3_9BACT|nr:DUF4340 domain-containing protein [Hyalangium sp. s54d21]MDY7229803.1 DUF4340 domain-containing protein [Hyalangium sp. s54d21]